jgi:hypothetical protein
MLLGRSFKMQLFVTLFFKKCLEARKASSLRRVIRKDALHKLTTILRHLRGERLKRISSLT